MTKCCKYSNLYIVSYLLENKVVINKEAIIQAIKKDNC